MEIKDLIIDDRQRGIFRVHRSSMTSDDLFQREREQIFSRCWIYLGHESEVENPGDYRRRTVADDRCSSPGAGTVRCACSSTPVRIGAR